MKIEKYVMVDTRSIVGNSVMFWCWDDMGYTCDLRMAKVWDEPEAIQQQAARRSDKAYKYSEVLKLVQHHVDIQDLSALGEGRVFPHTYSHLRVERSK